MGGPKSLVHDGDGTSWLARSVAVLEDGGCDGVTVVLGAGSDRATALLTNQGFLGDVVNTQAEFRQMQEKIFGFLSILLLCVALVSLVDLPDVGADVVARLVARFDASPAAHPSRGAGAPGGVLERAAYAGVPGHPVVLGRDHWSGVTGTAAGDRGARDYLSAHAVTLVECGDLATGADVDSRPTGFRRMTVPPTPRRTGTDREQ